MKAIAVLVLLLALAPGAALAEERGDRLVLQKEDLPTLQERAEQGAADAQYSLGNMYRWGKGMPQNNAEALKWHRKAAEQGNNRAQSCLGFMYRDGRGVPKNYIEAYAWFSVAAAQQSEEDVAQDGVQDLAEARDEVAKVLTPEQIARGQALASEYWEKYVKPF